MRKIIDFFSNNWSEQGCFGTNIEMRITVRNELNIPSHKASFKAPDRFSKVGFSS